MGKGGRTEKSDEEERFLTERLAVYEKALSMPMPSGDMLIARGVFSDAAYRASRAMVTSARIG